MVRPKDRRTIEAQGHAYEEEKGMACDTAPPHCVHEVSTLVVLLDGAHF